MLGSDGLLPEVVVDVPEGGEPEGAVLEARAPIWSARGPTVLRFTAE